MTLTNVKVVPQPGLFFFFLVKELAAFAFWKLKANANLTLTNVEISLQSELIFFKSTWPGTYLFLLSYFTFKANQK